MTDTSPQLEDGYIRIAMELFEAMIPKTPAHISVFLAIMRETYGFKRKSADISTQRFRILTGIERRNTIYRAIQKAVDLNMINALKTEGKRYPTYSINKRYDQWQNALKTEGALKTECMRTQKRVRRNSKLSALCTRKIPLKNTIKDTIGPTNRRRQLPPDFFLTDSRKQYASDNGITESRIKEVFDQFTDHHRARGSTMLDWDAAWRTWVRNDKKFSRQNHETERDAWMRKHGLTP